MNPKSYFVGLGKDKEVRLSGMSMDKQGVKSQTSVFQSSDLLLVSWVREQMLLMDDAVGVNIYLLNPDDDEMWRQITMREFSNMFVHWSNRWR
tara:strand:+ start:1697 stop:1975 length:279 start_codon:yes stop_codon:yes gene_type:complete